MLFSFSWLSSVSCNNWTGRHIIAVFVRQDRCSVYCECVSVAKMKWWCAVTCLLVTQGLAQGPQGGGRAPQCHMRCVQVYSGHSSEFDQVSEADNWCWSGVISIRGSAQWDGTFNLSLYKQFFSSMRHWDTKPSFVSRHQESTPTPPVIRILCPSREDPYDRIFVNDLALQTSWNRTEQTLLDTSTSDSEWPHNHCNQFKITLYTIFRASHGGTRTVVSVYVKL